MPQLCHFGYIAEATTWHWAHSVAWSLSGIRLLNAVRDKLKRFDFSDCQINQRSQQSDSLIKKFTKSQ